MISENNKESFGGSQSQVRGWQWYSNTTRFNPSKNTLGFQQPYQSSSPFDVYRIARNTRNLGRVNY